jgi:alpha-N-acetylglucosaminidase
VEPLDPVYQLIGKLFIETQTSEFGTDHIYNADTYNEMEPSSNNPDYLKLSAAAVYKGAYIFFLEIFQKFLRGFSYFRQE